MCIRDSSDTVPGKRTGWTCKLERLLLDVYKGQRLYQWRHMYIWIRYILDGYSRIPFIWHSNNICCSVEWSWQRDCWKTEEPASVISASRSESVIHPIFHICLKNIQAVSYTHLTGTKGRLLCCKTGREYSGWRRSHRRKQCSQWICSYRWKYSGR